MRTIGALCLLIAIAGGVYIASAYRIDREISRSFNTQQRFDRAAELLNSVDADPAAKQQARKTIDRLSRADPPFIQANKFLADEIRKRGYFKSDKNEFGELLRNLEVAADGGDMPSQKALIQFYILSRQNDLAIRWLRELVDHKPEFNLQLAQVLRRTGETELANSTAKFAIDHYKQQIELSSAKAADFVGLANGYSMLEQHDEAITALEAGHKHFPALKERLANALVAQADRVQFAKPEEKDSMAPIFQYLTRAIKADATNMMAWAKIHEISKRQDDTGTRAARWLQAGRNSDKTNGAIEIVLSAVAFFDSDIDRAIRLLESAVNKSAVGTTNYIRAKNNLASYLAQAEPPQFERAIEIVNQLVVDHPSAIETRGQILALAGRDTEAMSDLTRVLVRNPTHVGATETIARIWEKQGLSEKAKAIRARLRRLTSNSIPETPPIDYEAIADPEGNEGT